MLVRLTQADQMSHCPRDHITITLDGTLEAALGAQNLGDVTSDRRLLRNDRDAHPVNLTFGPTIFRSVGFSITRTI